MTLVLPVYRHDDIVAETRVDDDVLDTIVMDSTLRLSSDGYVKVRGLRLHRVIAGVPVGDPTMVDHWDRDRLHNCRANFRLVCNAANSQNQSNRGATSKHRGVMLHQATGRWQARMRLDYGRVDLHGLFDTEEEAAAQVALWRAEHMPYSEEAAR